MKIFLKTVSLGLVLWSLSCKEMPKDKVESNAANSKEKSYEIHHNSEQCFLYAKNKDSIKLKMNRNKDVVRGQLEYSFYEKDGSFGKFDGIMKGDTLYADYDFEAEGIQSKREVIFLKNGPTLIEGNGDLEMEGHHTIVFKKDAQISFDRNFPLTLIDCDKLNW